MRKLYNKYYMKKLLPILFSFLFVTSFFIFTPALAHAQTNLYVANGIDGTVSVIDPQTNQIVKTIPVGVNPYRDFSYNNTLYVANYSSSSISVINETTNTV